MKIELIGKPEIIISNPDSLHNYFAWPSIAKLKNGKIAVGCSGYRLEHICPFGKSCISLSEDNGKTYSLPTPIIDTVLDDRDTGITPFGENGAIVTSFNNTVDFQRHFSTEDLYRKGYLNKITPEQEEKAIGAEFRISFDNCNTFGEIFKSPVTSPHGPTELSDGTILWVGRIFSDDDSFIDERNGVLCYEVMKNGEMKYKSSIFCEKELNLCEPHTVECDDSTLICHLRSDTQFTLYQSESYDKGNTWTVPHRLMDDKSGAPAHLLKTNSGMLISVYGYREYPYGIRMMFSEDNGKTWNKDFIIYENEISSDIGYPASIQLADSSFITVFYAHPEKNSPAVILQQKWKFANTQ